MKIGVYSNGDDVISIKHSIGGVGTAVHNIITTLIEQGHEVFTIMPADSEYITDIPAGLHVEFVNLYLDVSKGHAYNKNAHNYVISDIISNKLDNVMCFGVHNWSTNSLKWLRDNVKNLTMGLERVKWAADTYNKIFKDRPRLSVLSDINVSKNDPDFEWNNDHLWGTLSASKNYRTLTCTEWDGTYFYFSRVTPAKGTLKALKLFKDMRVYGPAERINTDKINNYMGRRRPEDVFGSNPCSAFVLLSRGEYGIPQALMEALNYGIPVVITNFLHPEDVHRIMGELIDESEKFGYYEHGVIMNCLEGYSFQDKYYGRSDISEIPENYPEYLSDIGDHLRSLDRIKIADYANKNLNVDVVYDKTLRKIDEYYRRQT